MGGLGALFYGLGAWTWLGGPGLASGRAGRWRASGVGGLCVPLAGLGAQHRPFCNRLAWGLDLWDWAPVSVAWVPEVCDWGAQAGVAGR